MGFALGFSLGRCEPQLEENLIDGRALSLLSQEDLIDLGVPQHLCEAGPSGVTCAVCMSGGAKRSKASCFGQVIFEEIQKLFEESAVQV